MPSSTENLMTNDSNVASDDEAIRNCPDDKLEDFVIDLCQKNTAKYPSGKSQGTRISQGYVLRDVRIGMIYLSDVKAAIDLARNLGIRAPTMERLIKTPKWWTAVYTYIPGESLESLLPRISEQETIRLAFQLRDMLRIMQQKSNDFVGSIHRLRFDPGHHFLEDDPCGLPMGSATTRDLARVVNFWHNHNWYEWIHRGYARSWEEEDMACSNGPLPENLPLVFTHGNLVPRNIIRDENGDIWIVGWDHAGWYPACFERCGMRWPRGLLRRTKNPQHLPRMEYLWGIFCSVATDNQWEEEAQIIHEASVNGFRSSSARDISASLGVTKSRRLFYPPRGHRTNRRPV
ncbi:hypothetical protein TWF281_004054 [Arthrobotrys megalospora]